MLMLVTETKDCTTDSFSVDFFC